MMDQTDMPTADLRLGDCLDVMAGMGDGSVDAVVTDPPYDLGTGKGRGFMGKAWDGTGVAFRPETWAEVLRVLKPGGYLLAFGGTRTFHRQVCAIEDGGFIVRDTLMWLHGQGFPKSKACLKPAWEPITLAARPAKTVRELGIDGCRIGMGEDRAAGGVAKIPSVFQAKGNQPCRPSGGRWPANVLLQHHESCEQVGTRRVKGTNISHSSAGDQVWCEGGGWKAKQRTNHADPDGLETVPDWRCAEGCPVAMLDGQAGVSRDGVAGKRNGVAHVTLHGLGARDEPWGGYGGEGGPSRFFYCAKASRRDRHEGCEGMEAKALNWSSGDKSPGTFQAEGTDKTSPNHHPTVKPTDLMRWLVRLITRPGDLILDPFAGSGSTGKACVLEGRRFVGIEQDAAYLEIARHRITSALASAPLFSGAAP
jgi:site-specific DNA-methyltransferase (adenine-specific)